MILTSYEHRPSSQAPTVMAKDQGALGTTDRGVQVALIILITLVSATAIAAILILVAKLYRRRRQKQQYDTVPNMSQQRRGITDDEELQRIIMIRKSLASRTSTTLAGSRAGHRDDEEDAHLEPDIYTGSSYAQQPHDDHPQPYDHHRQSYTEPSSSRPLSMRDDWKEFEAGLQSHPSVSLANHPILRSSPGSDRSSVSLADHPIFRNSSEFDLSSHTPIPYTPSPLSIRSGLASPPPVVAREERI